MYQNVDDTIRYVFTAKTSHISGERKFGHISSYVGIGNMNHAIHSRPMCTAGYKPAIITEKTVIASAARPITVRQCWRVRNSIAEMSVPACAIPTHQTKLIMSQPHMTGLLLPQTPTPVEIL